MKKQIYIRTDGNYKIGFGHVIRCTALADMLRDNFVCIFLIQKPSAFLIYEIKNVNANYIELPETHNYILEATEIATKLITNKDIVILDGYNFNTEYQQIIKNTDCKLICIDDIHQYHFVADAVINHGGEDCETKYSISKQTKLYLGLDYLIVRKQFYENKKGINTDNKITNILITFGGSNTFDLQKKVVNSVLKIDAIENINLITSSKQTISEMINHDKVNIYENLKIEDLIDIANKSHLIICAASTFALEMLVMNKIILCGYFVDNQINIYNSLLKHKLIIDLDNLNCLDETQIIAKIKLCFNNSYLCSKIMENSELITQNNIQNNIKNIFC